MSARMSVTVRAFADRRLLVLDASDGAEAAGELPFRESRSAGLGPPGRQGCYLQSDQERDVTVELTVHDTSLDVGEGFEHLEFDGGDKLALRGLFGDPYATLSAAADRWHLAATYYEQQWFWRVHLWPAEAAPVVARAPSANDLFVTGTNPVRSASGTVVDEPYVWVTVQFEEELAEDRLDNLSMWLDQEIHLRGLDYHVEAADLDKIMVKIRSAVPRRRLDDLCERLNAALGRIVRDVPFRTSYQ